MKNLKLITAMIAILLAVGGAFITQAEEANTAKDIAMLATADDSAILASYRTIPSNPGSCTVFGTVACSPTAIGPNCIMNINGQSKQLYDANNCSQPLYYDPVK